MVAVTSPRKFRLEWEMESSKTEGGRKVMFREKYKRADRNVLRIVKKTFCGNFNPVIPFQILIISSLHKCGREGKNFF